jgi:actin-related protein/Ca2+-binding EF-hand superfamily protein
LTTEGAWWQGYTADGAVGCFPGNYVKMFVKTAPAPAKPAAAAAAGAGSELDAVYQQMAAEARSEPAKQTPEEIEAAAKAKAEADAAAAQAKAEAEAAQRKEALAERLRKMLTGEADGEVEETDEARVKRVFTKLDHNHDGRISRAELDAQLRKWERAGVDISRAAEFFPGADELEYEAFRDGVAALERGQPRRQVVLDKAGLKALFNHYDRDNTGRIERRRLKHLLKKLDWDALGTTRSKVLRYFHGEVAGTQPIEFSELLDGIQQMAFSDLDEERRQNFFRVMHGKTARRRRQSVAQPGASGPLSSADLSQLARLLPQHRDDTAASQRVAKMRAAFSAGLIRSNSTPNLGAVAAAQRAAAAAAVASSDSGDEGAADAAATAAAAVVPSGRPRSNSTGSLARTLRRPVKPDAVIVIDNGSSFIKVGVSGEPLPRFILPAIVGQTDERDAHGLPPLFGYDALRYDGADRLRIARPLDPAKETDWPRLTALWDYVFEDLLHVLPEEHHVLMTELPDMSAQSTRRLYELMFEYFEVQSLYVGNQAEMALFADGIETGIVVDCFPEHDHQILTNRGFMFLDEVEAAVEFAADARTVVNWRGLEVASYDAKRDALVYQTPSRLIVKRGTHELVEFVAPRDISVVATRGHSMYVRSDTSSFEKVTAKQCRDREQIDFLALARGGVGSRCSKRRDSGLLALAASVGVDATATTTLHALLRLYGQCIARQQCADEAQLAALGLSPRASFGVVGDGRLADWVWQLSTSSLQRIVRGALSASGGARALYASGVALRDDLVRMLMHAGFSVTFGSAAAVGGCWIVQFDDCDAPSVRQCGVREFRQQCRTWCFDLNDGFVVVRRAQRVPRAQFGGAAPADAAWVVTAASRATIQGNCGNRMQIVPVVEGTRLPHATIQLRVGAGNLNEFLARIITEHGNYFDPLVDVEALDAIKAAVCRVSIDPQRDGEKSELSQERTFVLKNGKKVTVGSESWRCPEGMFQPSLMGLDIAGVHGNVFNAIQKSPIDVRNELFGHIVLSGGSTLFPGFAERLHKEVRMLMNVASQRHLNIVSSHKRKYAAWIGAAGFAALDTFPSTTLFIDDYFDGALEKHLAAQGRTL